jgi:hypothetical protein
VEEGTLSMGYEITAKAWKSRFGVPYSVCGCGPTSSGVVEKLARFLGGRPSTDGVNVGLAKPKNPRPDLVSINDEDADATHPSEHNSVVVVQHAASKVARQAREKKVQRHNKEMAKVAEKSRYKDEWERLRYQRALRSRHNDAFLAPIPYWGM